MKIYTNNITITESKSHTALDIDPVKYIDKNPALASIFTATEAASDVLKFDWVASDHHFGDGRTHLLYRPFANAEEMREHAIAEHNKVVAPTDRVLFLGDFAIDNEHVEQCCAEMNGKKTLVKGNHDNKLDIDFHKHFERVVEHDVGINVEVAGMNFFAVHYPRLANPKRMNLVGHVHGCWRLQPNMINVSVDCHFLNFRLESGAASYCS